MKCDISGIANELGMEEKDAKAVLKKVKDMSNLERAETYNHPISRMLRVLDGAGVYLGDKKVNLQNLELSKGVFTISYEYKGEVRSTEIRREVGLQLGNGYKLNEDSLNDLLKKVVFLDVFDGYEAMGHDITNTPGEIIKLAKELEELGNDSPKHARTLKERISWLSDSASNMVTEINVHLNKEADRTGGFLDVKGDSADMYIGIGKLGHKSPLEVYVHELFHAVTSYAINSRNPDISHSVKRMEAIREDLIKNTTGKDLVKASRGTMTLEEAEAMLNYITNEKEGLHEFVSLAMSNEALGRLLEKRDSSSKKEEYPNLVAEIVGRMKSILDKVIAKITKEPKGDDLSKMVFLVEKISRANKRGLQAKKTSILSNLLNLVVPVENVVKEYMDKGLDKARNRPITKKAPRGNVQEVWHGAKLAMRAIYDDKARGAVAASGALSNVGVLQPEGTVASAIRDMFESDNQQDVVEMMGMMSQQIDQGRELRFMQMQKTIAEGFQEELTEGQEIALTDAVIDTDMTSLYPDYSMQELQELLEDSSKLKAEIKKRKGELRGKVDIQSYRYYEIQAHGLAKYMVSGYVSATQLLNAENIANKLNTAVPLSGTSKEVVTDIDQLATLMAMDKANTASKYAVSGLMARDMEGVQNLVMHLGGAKIKADEKVFNKPGERYHKIKGYSSEIAEEDVEVTVAPLSDTIEMERAGFKLNRVLQKHGKDSNKVATGLFVNSQIVKPGFHRVGMRVTNRSSRGTTLRESYGITGHDMVSKRANADVNRLTAEVVGLTTKMQMGTYKPEMEDEANMSPILDSKGRVADYRYMLNKEAKKDILGLDRRASHVTGRTVASIFDKAQTSTYNEAMMNLIVEDARVNNPNSRTVTKDNKVYIKIEKESPEAEVRELWKVLPKDIKLKYANGFMLRRDLMHGYLGYRELSIADAPIIKDMPAAVKYGIQVAERIWKEIVKISKVDIVIRTPAVLIGNVISNFMLSAMTGESVVDIARLQMQGVKELNNYISMTKELIDLQAKIDAGKGSVAVERRIGMLKNNLENSSAKDLIDAGFYTTILEEVEADGKSTNNLFGKRIGNAYGSTPKIVRDGVDMLYITGNTRPFKLMSAATQYSDFVARYAQYHLMVKKGVDKNSAIKTVRDAYINYNKPNSRFVEWSNQMGFIMFTKYFVRIQKAIKEHASTHPLKVVAAILGQELVIGDVDDITDQSLLQKDLGVLFYNPIDQLIRAATPSGIEAISSVMR